MKNYEIWMGPAIALVLLAGIWLWARAQRKVARDPKGAAAAHFERVAEELRQEQAEAQLPRASHKFPPREPEERRRHRDVDNTARRRSSTDDYPHHQAAAMSSSPSWPEPVSRSSSWMVEPCASASDSSSSFPDCSSSSSDSSCSSSCGGD